MSLIIGPTRTDCQGVKRTMSQATDNERFATEVQRWLRSTGRYAGKVDGWAGAGTVTAFRQATNTEMPAPPL